MSAGESSLGWEVQQWMLDIWTMYGFCLMYGLIFLAVHLGNLGLVPRRLAGTKAHLQWVSRIPSTLHAFLACYGGMQVLYEPESLLAWQGDAEMLTYGATPLRNFWIMHTCGYIVYDLFLCVYYHRALGDTLTLLHHVLIVVAFAGGVLVGSGTFYLGTLLLNEISTPLLNINFFMAATNNKGTLYKINGILLFVLFFLFRVALNGYWFLHLIYVAWPAGLARYGLPWEPPLEPWLTYFICVSNTILFFGFLILNLLWFKSLAVAVTRKLTTKPKKA